MRQSTPGNNFKHLIKEELVRRFESLVRDEIQRYEESISDNNKQFRLLNNRLDELVNQQKQDRTLIESIKIHCKKELIDEKNDLFEKFECQRRHVNEKVKSIESLTNDIFKQSESFISKQDLLDQVSILQSQMINIGLSAEKQKSQLCQCIHDIKEELSNLISDLETHTFKRFCDLYDKINKINENSETSKIDLTGVLKELQVYKKSVFIIEKNIENIYTKISRLQQV